MEEKVSIFVIHLNIDLDEPNEFHLIKNRIICSKKYIFGFIPVLWVLQFPSIFNLQMLVKENNSHKKQNNPFPGK